MLYGKNVVLGVSGGIACYKACEIVSRLIKLGANVDVVMTKHAEEFVTPLTFQTLARSAVTVDPFEPVKEYDIKHISLAKKADIFVVAPATANVIAKFANGVADDFLTTTYLACNAPKLICPAMNTAMYEDDATQTNMRILSERGVKFEDATVGRLACADVGKGRMAEPSVIVDRIVDMLTPSQSMHGMRVLITAGGTSENIDGVRFLGNRSSGKMGMALARACAERGGSVTLVYGNISVPLAECLEKSVYAPTTRQMYDECMRLYGEADIIIMAAAPADYMPETPIQNKLKGDSVTLKLKKNPDIAAAIGERKGDRKLVVFAAETQDLLDNAMRKLVDKNADLAVANDVSRSDIGFNSDHNEATIIDRAGNRLDTGRVTKAELADMIVEKVLAL